MIHLALIVLYLLGYLACYSVCRGIVFDRNDAREWALFERIIALTYSLLSWLAIAVLFCVVILSKTKVVNPDKIVKW